MAWTAALCGAGGQEVAELLGHTFAVRRELNRAATLRVDVDPGDEAAYRFYEVLSSATPLAKAWLREPADASARLIFSGLLFLAADGDDAGQGGLLKPEWRDPFGLLDYRHTPATVTYTGIDAGQIAWALIDATDANAYLAQGSIEATKPRDRTYERAGIAASIVNLTEVIEGFDFRIDPLELDVDGALGSFNVMVTAGTDRTNQLAFEFGHDTIDNVMAVSRTIEPPVNRAIMRGAGEPPLESVVTDAASIAAYGAWEKVETQSDISEQETLDDRAARLLQPDPIQRIRFDPDPATAPRPFVDYDVGDTVSFKARKDSFAIDTQARLTAIEVTVDASGVEQSHRLEFGTERPRKPSDLFRDIRQRLDRLEQ